MPTHAERLKAISGAVFFEMERKKSELREAGRSVIDLGIGSPDQTPARHVHSALHAAIDDPGAYGYPRTQGTPGFRQAAAHFLSARYQVDVDSDTEVLTLLGAQDGLAHLALAVADPGDIVLVPDPGYPIYEVSVRLAGATPYPVPLREDEAWLPDLQAIPEDIARRAKLLILNYPNNPTTAMAPVSVFDDAIAFAKRYDLWVLHDAAYIELTFDSTDSAAGPAPSFLARPGAKDVGIEMHSLSKTFHFAGPRLAFAAGNAELLRALTVIKSNIDYGVFTPIQSAGIAALRDHHGAIAAARALYLQRRDAFLAPLIRAGWAIPVPQATMFVWAKVPTTEDSRAFADRLLRQTGIACVPGIGFGRSGEGYVRFSLVRAAVELNEAATRITAVL